MNDNIVTIKEDYFLPSGGKLYSKPFDARVELRSMTVAEEMKRLSPTKTPYKHMSDIIESCLLTKLPVSVYDMCMGDYIYLLHRLRVVTYGPDYNIKFECPNCGEIESATINLDDLDVLEYSDELNSLMTITLPRTRKVVKLKFQTPRDLDYIIKRTEELKKQFKDIDDNVTLLLTVQSFIESIDGEPVNPITFTESIKQLPAYDYNYLLSKATKLQEKVGINTNIKLSCNNCGTSVNTTFRYTDEFFRPEVD